MWGRIVLGLCMVGVVAAALVGVRMLGSEPDDADTGAGPGTVRLPGGEATRGDVGETCPPSTRSAAREAGETLDRRYGREYGDGAPPAFRGATVSRRSDVEVAGRSYVVLATVAEGDRTVPRLSCFADVQVLWSEFGSFDAG